MSFAELQAKEIARARAKHPVTHQSAHYFYGVILEEVDEFWDLVKAQRPSKSAMLDELVQIAAMCQRAAEDLKLEEVRQVPDKARGVQSDSDETIQQFYNRVDPANADEGLRKLAELHKGKIPPLTPGETLASYFHRTDPL